MSLLATTVNRNLGNPLFAGLRRDAYAAGLDFFHRFAANQWSISGTMSGPRIAGSAEAMTAAQRSSARYYQRPDQDYVKLDPTATSMTGWSSSLSFGKVAGRWTIATDLFATSSGFEVNDGGYNTDADEIFHGIIGSRGWLDPGSVFRRFTVS